jgi:flagellar hook-basal body complex protein FliE
MNINSIGTNWLNIQANNAQTQNQVQNKTFSQVLDNAITQTNNEQLTAYNSMQAIATGKVDNLQEAVQTIEEAELSLRLGLEVKNKALNAFKEVMRMQI